MAKKETIEYRKANNLCPRDGRPNAPGRKMCERCLKKAAEKTERYRQKKIKANLCTNCGISKPAGTSRLCDLCKERAAVYLHTSHTRRYARRKQAGQCVDCSQPSVSGRTMCQDCLDKRAVNQKAKRESLIEQGLCVQCGKQTPVGDGKRCADCVEKRNEWYQGSTTQKKDKARRDANRLAVLAHYGGKCVKCGEMKPHCLAVDHIHGDGNTHRRTIGKHGSGFFKWLVDNDFPDGFQILCHNCNMEKHLRGRR